MIPALQLRVEVLEKELSRVQKMLEEDKFIQEYIFMKYFGEEYKTGNLLYQNRAKKPPRDVHGRGRRWSRRSLLTTSSSANVIFEGSVVAGQQNSRPSLEFVALEDCSEKDKTFVVFDYNHGKPLDKMPPSNNNYSDRSSENHHDPPHSIRLTTNDPENSRAVPSPAPVIEDNHGETADSTSPQGDMPIQEHENKSLSLPVSTSDKNEETNLEKPKRGHNDDEMPPDSGTTPMEINNAEFESYPELNIELFTQDKSFDCQHEDPVPVSDSNDPPSRTLAKLEKFKNQARAIGKVMSENKSVENPSVGSPAPMNPENEKLDPPINDKTPSVEDIQQEPMEQEGPKIPSEEEQSSDDSIVEVAVIIGDGSKKLPPKEMVRTRAACRRKGILPESDPFLPLQPPANDKSHIDISKYPVRQKRKIRRLLKWNKANKRSKRICEAFVSAGDDNRGYVKKLPKPNDSCDSLLILRKCKSTKKNL